MIPEEQEKEAIIEELRKTFNENFAPKQINHRLSRNFLKMIISQVIAVALFLA